MEPLRRRHCGLRGRVPRRLEQPRPESSSARFFEPEAFTVPPRQRLRRHRARGLRGAVVRRGLAGLIDTRYAKTEARQEVTVGGNRGFRLELVATGEGLNAKDTRTYVHPPPGRRRRDRGADDGAARRADPPSPRGRQCREHDRVLRARAGDRERAAGAGRPDARRAARGSRGTRRASARGAHRAQRVPLHSARTSPVARSRSGARRRSRPGPTRSTRLPACCACRTSSRRGSSSGPSPTTRNRAR